MSSEFNIIQNCFVGLCRELPAGDLGIGDDAAVLSVPVEHQVVVATDTLVQGIHFPEKTPAQQVAWKALAVNLSDLAAMGAKPWCYSLSLSVPKSLAKQQWFADFSKGLADLCAHLNLKIPLVGGDTTSAKEGALSVTISAQGLVKQGKAVYRRGACVNDWIVVTGNLGEGALGLQVDLDKPEVCSMPKALKLHALKALNTPVPQTAVGQMLSGIVNSAIDISDGLLQDLTHILRQSSFGNHSVAISAENQMQKGLGAKINLQEVPVSEGMKAYFSQTKDWGLALSGGDDYQLCLTVSETNWQALQELAKALNVKVTRIGKIINRPVIELVGQNKTESLDWQNAENLTFGFQHF
ncbi:thiamine-phosphate kinase [Thiomicrorhabdus indica]|uniref:thiamine-phosphate kinase n=1 Tax=Thiomicrorhabdus indica TaxID=2267253 RepID=UPI00102DD43C|nr:thiamine-phosphate kinase [Thiomicrorhabdus indica]